MTPEQKEKGLLAELNNGRLAMIGERIREQGGGGYGAPRLARETSHPHCFAQHRLESSVIAPLATLPGIIGLISAAKGCIVPGIDAFPQPQ